MKLCCKTCKCDICGNIHRCEIMCDRIMKLDTEDENKKCSPILDCDMFNVNKNYVEFHDWKCPIKKLVKAGELK